jgi:hypothetical protein
MEIANYIIEQALIIIPALWVIGAILKNTPRIPDWTIPYFLLIFGVLGAVGILGISVFSVIQGVLVTGAAVLGHQLVKQTRERRK